MMTERGTTRLALLRSAERLFADGIETPSLREITRDAQQRNTSALQYHFNDRDDLLLSVLARHDRSIDIQRHALLDQLALTNEPDHRTLAAALVIPIANKLSDPDGGIDYLKIMGEVVGRPLRFKRAIVPEDPESSLNRWCEVVTPILPKVVVGPPLHRRFAAIRFTHNELASRARERPDGDNRLFVNHLVDVVLAILSAPPSQQTLSLLRSPDD